MCFFLGIFFREGETLFLRNESLLTDLVHLKKEGVWSEKAIQLLLLYGFLDHTPLCSLALTSVWCAVCVKNKNTKNGSGTQYKIILIIISHLANGRAKWQRIGRVSLDWLTH